VRAQVVRQHQRGAVGRAQVADRGPGQVADPGRHVLDRPAERGRVDRSVAQLGGVRGRRGPVQAVAVAGRRRRRDERAGGRVDQRLDPGHGGRAPLARQPRGRELAQGDRGGAAAQGAGARLGQPGAEPQVLRARRPGCAVEPVQHGELPAVDLGRGPDPERLGLRPGEPLGDLVQGVADRAAGCAGGVRASSYAGRPARLLAPRAAAARSAAATVGSRTVPAVRAAARARVERVRAAGTSARPGGPSTAAAAAAKPSAAAAATQPVAAE
jgi:hypothetical protein